MTRPLRVRALLVFAALLASGCQDYNFNPVGKCLIAPARERYSLSDISTADVLFVVDDSGSMKAEQDALAAGFDAFIQNLDAENVDRVARGLEPIDFHIAVTTTSVFYNNEIADKTVVCRSDCPQAAGKDVCCEMTSTQAGLTPARPYLGYQRCSAASECGGSLDCRTDCAGLLGEKFCCDPTTKLLPAPSTPVACSSVGSACGAMQTHYRFDASCVPGNAVNGTPYPQGAFVGFKDNPRVLHFDKELYLADGVTRDPTLPACPAGVAKCNRQGFSAAQLKAWFASDPGTGWQGNIIAGTCGSGEEQGLQAGKLAVQKALAKQQLDTRDARGNVASAPAAWPHDRSKLVLVFVGDEDDCSAPIDPSTGVIMTATDSPGNDACTADAGLSADKRRQTQVADFVDYFTGLGRPVAAAFVVSTAQSACVDGACSPGICCPLDASGNYACQNASGAPVCSTNTCGGQGPGVRLLDAAARIGSREMNPRPEIVEGSICENVGGFSGILNRVAEIVKPPNRLTLPTQPASGEITVLRIAAGDGTTRQTCRGPAPAGITAAQAVAEKWDWWFTADSNQADPVEVSQYVFINHGDPPGTGTCEANPGETYSADYVGQLPIGGCQTRSDCLNALGGSLTPPSWSCYAGGDATTAWIQPTPSAPGTCVCGDLGLDSTGLPSSP